MACAQVGEFVGCHEAGAMFGVGFSHDYVAHEAERHDAAGEQHECVAGALKAASACHERDEADYACESPCGHEGCACGVYP